MMNRRKFVRLSSVLAAGICGGLALWHAPRVQAQAQAGKPAMDASAAKPSMNSDVAALFHEISAAYGKLNSYQHTELFTQEAPDREGKMHSVSRRFTLAMQRPNKFVFRGDNPNMEAAASDGKTFVQYRNNEYRKMAAPATYKDINIVDDVQFYPQATYLAAMALQGNALADKQVAAMFAPAKMGATAQSNGKTFRTIVLAPQPGYTITLYVEQKTHLMDKMVYSIKRGAAALTITEQFQNVQVNKPVADSVFAYTPPTDAKLVAKFTDPQELEEKQLQAQAAKYEGKPAPDFTVQDRGGHDVKLSDMKGKIVVVDFWASWCGPCRMVMPTIQEIHDKYTASNVTVMAVDTWDKKEDCDQFLADNTKYTMPVLLDPAGPDSKNSIAGKLYGVNGIPTTLFIDRDGTVRRYAVGSHPREFYLNALKDMGVQVAAK